MIQVLTVLIRAGLQAVAGGLISNGVITDTDIAVISGAAVAVATVIWSIIEKKYLANKLPKE